MSETQHFKTYIGTRTRDEAIEKLKIAGWELAESHSNGISRDFEAFTRSNNEAGYLIIDFGLTRFIFNDGKSDRLLDQCSKADGEPEYDAILDALFSKERQVGEDPLCSAKG